MTDPAKKDDHGHTPPKVTLGQKLAKIGVSVFLTLIFLYFLVAVVPSIVTAAAELLRQIGNTLVGFKEAIRVMSVNLRGVIKEILLNLVVPGILLFYIGKKVKELLFTSKNDDSHGH
jgi:hypothetical protein